MFKSKTTSLVMVFLMVVSLLTGLSCIRAQAAVTQSWDWRNFGNTEGWVKNSQIDDWQVAYGQYTLHIPNGTIDPNITSPTLAVATTTYKILEITYRNETGNTSTRIYWHPSGQGFSEANSQGITTIADNGIPCKSTWV